MTRKPKLPPGGRWTAAGRISLQIKDPHNLVPVPGQGMKPRRVKPRDIIPTEPASYATADEAWAAYYRLREAIKEKVERGVTVRQFWLQWTDLDHWAWKNGRSRERTPQTRISYAQRTKKFVDTFGGRPMASITRADVLAYMSSGKGTHSQVSSLRAFFTDSMRDEAGPLRTDNPFDQIAKTVRRVERKKRAENWIEPPSPVEIERLLAHTLEHEAYSLYAWLRFGTETGMRCGEIDAMKVENLDLKGMRYRVEEQFNHKLQAHAAPKYNSYRWIVLPETLRPVIRRLVLEGGGSPYLLVPARGRRGHYTHDTREWFWSRKVVNGSKGLRSLLGDPKLTMYESTRHYFTTQAVLNGAPIHFLATHLGHSDNGETLMRYYARLNDDQSQAGMREFFAKRPAAPTQIRKVS